MAWQDWIADLTFAGGSATGFLVGPNDLMTNVHVVLDDNGRPRADLTARFENGVTVQALSVDYFDVRDLYDPGGTIYSSNVRYDIAIVTLAEPVGEQRGWFGLAHGPAYRPAELTVAGYPGHPYSGSTLVDDTVAVDYDLRHSRIDYRSDKVHPGSSGSPLWTGQGDALYAVGVQSVGDARGGRGAALFDDRSFSSVREWIANNDPPTPPPSPPNSAPRTVYWSETREGAQGAVIAADDPDGTRVGRLATVDPDAGDTHSYTLLDDAGGRFELRGDAVHLRAGAALMPSHSLVVRATDAAGDSVTATLTVRVTPAEPVAVQPPASPGPVPPPEPDPAPDPVPDPSPDAVPDPPADRGFTGEPGPDGLYDQQEIALLYAVALGRAPDLPGLNFWLNKALAQDGMSVEQIAGQFYFSDGLATVLGAHPDTLSDSAIVEALYSGVLDRSAPASQADPAGFAFWVAQVEDGLSRPALLRAFAITPETVADAGFLDTLAQNDDGLWLF